MSPTPTLPCEVSSTLPSPPIAAAAPGPSVAPAMPWTIGFDATFPAPILMFWPILPSVPPTRMRGPIWKRRVSPRGDVATTWLRARSSDRRGVLVKFIAASMGTKRAPLGAQGVSVANGVCMVLHVVRREELSVRPARAANREQLSKRRAAVRFVADRYRRRQARERLVAGSP